jgi:succinoglycan biosynthesis transport protein ExoP
MTANWVDYNSAPDSRLAGFDLVEVVRMLWSHRWRIALFTVLGLLCAFAAALVLPKSYVAKGELVVRAESSIVSDAEHSFYASAVNSAVVATEQQVMDADGILSRVADTVTFPPALEQPGWLSSRVQDVLSWLHLTEDVDPGKASALRAATRLSYIRSAVRAVAGKDSSVIALQASTPDPVFSADIINHLLDYYMQERIASQGYSSKSVATALQERLQQTNEQIREAEQRVASLLQKPGMIEDSEIPGLQKDFTLLAGDLSRARAVAAERQAAYDSAASLRAEAGGDPDRLSELLDMGGLSTSNLRRLYSEKQADYALMSAKLKPDNLLAPQAQLAQLRKKLVAEADRIVRQRKADLDAANQVIASLSRRYEGVRSQNTKDSGSVLLVSRERDNLANLRRVAGEIQDRLIAVAAQPVDPNARILTRATVPVLPAFPDKTLFSIAGGLLGFILSSVTVLVAGFVRRLRLSASEQAGLLAGPLLGSVPKFNALNPRNLGVLDQPRNADAGAADIALLGVAIELENVLARSKAKVLAITSALPNEGKSTVAVALGRNFAGFGWRVLLLHCDLHPGATRYVAERRAADYEPAHSGLRGVVKDRNSSLHVLMFPASANPVSFLRSDEFSDIVRWARQEYDLVLCDTPPILSVPDGLVVARLCDTVVLVSEFNRTGSTAEAAELSRRVAATGKPVCGVVVTKTQPSDAAYGSYGVRYGTYDARLEHTSAGSGQPDYPQ